MRFLIWRSGCLPVLFHALSRYVERLQLPDLQFPNAL